MSSDMQSPHRVVPPKRRRDKPILSCSLCRKRKLKCDRQQPCSSCVHRGLSSSCTYVPNPPLSGSKTTVNVHDRINQLEELVTSLIDEKSKYQRNPGTDSRPPSRPSLHDDADGEVPGTPDRVVLNEDATSYTNSGHWTSILDGITELRDELDRIVAADEPTTPTKPEHAGPDLLFSQRHVTHQELLAAIPPKQEADNLLNTYFACMDMASVTIHQQTFMRKYEQFWKAPYDTPIMWLGMLFSLFSTASRFKALLDDPQCLSGSTHISIQSLDSGRIDFYREKAASAIRLANYAKCPPNTVEALLHYFLTEYFRSQDPQFAVWMLIGMIVRVALRMGYHRDPSRFPNISPFDGEMRRRTWLMVMQLDLLFSSQLGLPGMIQPSLHDVAEPRNLLDEDLHEDMQELPPSRPDTENTVMMSIVVRSRMLQIFKAIADLANSTSSPLYRDILQLDRDLRAIYEKFPPSTKAIRVKNFDYSDSKSSRRRLFLGLSYLRGMLMLHRPFLLLGRSEPRYEYSRVVCLNTALEILQYQRTFNAEAQPGGRLWSMDWKIWAASWKLSSVVSHDFLLATTVLTLDLDRDLASPVTVSSERAFDPSDTLTHMPTRAEIVEALTAIYPIWIGESERSREARKVAAAVRHVLRKVNTSIDVDYATFDADTPMSQFDFATFAQEGTQQLAAQETSSMFYDLDDAQYMRPLLTDEMFDVSYNNWGMGNNMAIPPASNNMFNSYMP